MICPTCAGPLTPFGHGYLECGECDAVFVNEAGRLVDVSFCQPQVIDIPVAILAPATVTVKRPDLFGQVHDTYQSETELNGFRPTQGALL